MKGDQAGEFDLALTMVGLAVGAVSLSSDEVARRLRSIPPEAEAGSRRDLETRRHVPLVMGDLAAGLAVESAEVVGRWSRVRPVQRCCGRRSPGTVPLVSAPMR
jgi:hypothetical protein